MDNVNISNEGKEILAKLLAKRAELDDGFPDGEYAPEGCIVHACRGIRRF